MRGRLEAEHSDEDGSRERDAAEGCDIKRATGTTPVFNPKGIGSNLILTAAAAVVPLVIVGMAGIQTILARKKSKR